MRSLDNPEHCQKRRQWISAGLASLFLWLLALSVFDSLHSRFHPDAHGSSHECIVTMLQRGQWDSSEPEVGEAPFDARELSAQIWAPAFVLLSTRLLLPPSCGPPVSA